MKRITSFLLLAAVALVLAPRPASAQMITQFNFNSVPPDANTATGTSAPSFGSGTASALGGTTVTYAAGSPGDTSSTTDNSGLNLSTFPTQGTGSGTAGEQFSVSTTGFLGQIQITLDFRQSGTASRFFQLLVTSDGTTYSAPSGGTTSIGTIPSGNTLTSFSNTGLYTNDAGGGSQTYVQSITYTLPAGAFSNDSNFGFEWVAVYDPNGSTDGNGSQYISSNAGTVATYATTGNARFDEVTVSAVPEPSAWVAMLVGTLGLVSVVRLRGSRRSDA